MPALPATFTGPDGQDPVTAIHATVNALMATTAGDLLLVGRVFRSRIRERTFRGVDVNGAPFAPYSAKGPYYFYPNREAAGSSRGAAAARKTAAANRHKATGGNKSGGVRTPYGIRYESYAAAKAAHGVAGVNLFGMEQHPHMLDEIMVKAGGSEIAGGTGDLDFGSDLAAFEQNQAETTLTLGFYGPEAERARGHNEGGANLPKREFFALNEEDLRLAERAIAQRMIARAQAKDGGPVSSMTTISLGGSEDLGF